MDLPYNSPKTNAPNKMGMRSARSQIFLCFTSTNAATVNSPTKKIDGTGVTSTAISSHIASNRAGIWAWMRTIVSKSGCLRNPRSAEQLKRVNTTRKHVPVIKKFSHIRITFTKNLFPTLFFTKSTV